jgi:hypothetical protein
MNQGAQRVLIDEKPREATYFATFPRRISISLNFVDQPTWLYDWQAGAAGGWYPKAGRYCPLSYTWHARRSTRGQVFIFTKPNIL